MLFRVEIWVDPDEIYCACRFDNVVSFTFRENSISVTTDEVDFLSHDTRAIDGEIVDVVVKPQKERV